MITLKLTGKKEIDKALGQVRLSVAHKELQKVNAEAAKPLADEAHLQAPVGKTGNLADSIGIVKPSESKVSVIGQVNIGPRRGGGHKGYHAHLVEYGKTNRDGTKSKANPFLKRAFDKKGSEVIQRIDRILGTKMVKRMKNVLK
jgi:HK97 gp10 family phage protein